MTGQDQNMDLQQRLTRLEGTLRSILEGGKPLMDAADPDSAWLPAQLERLRAGLFISETTSSYITRPQDTAEERTLKGVTADHPLSYALVQEQKMLEKRLEPEGIRNFKVLGVDYGFRSTQKDPLAQADYADALVLSRGDIYALWQFVSLLKARVENHDPALRDKILVLQNTGDFWAPLIKALALDAPALRAQNILKITGSHLKTARALDALGEWKGRAPKNSRDIMQIPPGSTILVATHNSKKIYEFRAIMEAQKADVHVLPFSNIMDKPEEAKETSLTYAGNDREKAEKAWQRLDQMGLDNVKAILDARRIDPYKTFLLFDDRGVELAEDFMKHSLFDECRSYLNPTKPGPGVEMASVLKSMSGEDFVARLEIAAAALSAERRRAGGSGAVDLAARNLTTYMFSPLMPDQTGARPVYSFFSMVDNSLTFTPRPTNDVCRYLDHFLVQNNDAAGRTAAEIPDFTEMKSTMALATRAAGYVLGLDKHRKLSPRVEFNREASPQRWRIGTPQALWGDAVVDSNENDSDERRFSFVKGDNGQYSPVLPPPGAEAPATIQQAAATLGNFQRFTNDSDAFLLTPDSANSFAQRMFTFFSLVVGKQIFDPAISGKPVVVVKSGWKDAIDIYMQLHQNGFIGDKPQHVFKQRDDREEGLNYIDKYLKHYIPDHVRNAEFREAGAKPPSDLFRVTVYCSATSTNAHYRKETRVLSFKLASQGYAVKNGGGSDGLMLQTSLGVHDFRAWWAKYGTGAMPRNHIASVQCEDTYQSEGLCDFNDYVCVQKDIFQRMADLADTDGEIVVWGGAGTVQEMFGSLMLREAGVTPVAGRPLVIVNSEVGSGKHRTPIFDPVINAMPADYLARLNVHVVKTMDKALVIMNDARRARAMEPANLPDLALFTAPQKLALPPGPSIQP